MSSEGEIDRPSVYLGTGHRAREQTMETESRTNDPKYNQVAIRNYGNTSSADKDGNEGRQLHDDVHLLFLS